MRGRFTTLFVMTLLLTGLSALGGNAFQIDTVMVRYPAGYTKLLTVDIAPFLTDPELRAGVIEPLRAANHPFVGVVRTLEQLRIPPAQVRYVALGEGPGVTSFALIQGPPWVQTFAALQGLGHAAQAPNSPFTHFEQATISGRSVFFAGGTFGPVTIEWAYVPTRDALWVGTEVAFQPDQPDVERLRATTDRIIAKLNGQTEAGYMDELHIAIQVRDGEIGFVRMSAPGEKPFEPGEQAMGFSLAIGEAGRVAGHFALRFASETAAQAAARRLQNGSSPYLAQDLYQAELTDLIRTGRVINFDVSTGLRGLTGLFMLVMPF